MISGNAKKRKQLKMSAGTASGKLKKNIMFALLQETGKNICFQCGKKIETVDTLSIEHKVPWLDSEDPIGLFFDLKNIAFSHLTCNIGNARKYNKKIRTREEILAGKRKYWKENFVYCPIKRKERYLRTGN